MLLSIAVSGLAQKNDSLTQKIAYPELPFTFLLPNYLKVKSYGYAGTIYAYTSIYDSKKGTVSTVEDCNSCSMSVETYSKAMSLNSWDYDSINKIMNAFIIKNSVGDCSKATTPIINTKYSNNKVPFLWVSKTCKKKTTATDSTETPISVAMAVYQFAEYTIRFYFSFETTNTQGYLKLAEEIAKSASFSEFSSVNRIGLCKPNYFEHVHFLYGAFSFCKSHMWKKINDNFSNGFTAKYQLWEKTTLEINQRSKIKTQSEEEYANTLKTELLKSNGFQELTFLQMEKKKNILGTNYLNLSFSAKHYSDAYKANVYIFLLNDTTVVNLQAVMNISPKDDEFILSYKKKVINSVIETMDNTGTREELLKDKFNFLVPAGWKIDGRSSLEQIGLLPLKGTEKEPVLIVKRLPKSSYKIQTTVDGIIEELKSDKDKEVTIQQDTIKSIPGEVRTIKATITFMGSKTFDTYAVFEKGSNIVIVKVASGRFSQKEYFTAFEKMVATILQYNP